MKFPTFKEWSLRVPSHVTQARIECRLAALAAVWVAMAAPAESALLSNLSLDTSDGLTLNGDAAITTDGQGKFGEALEWQAFDFALPATADGKTIYFEFRYQGANPSYLGFYLDDVTITY